MIFDIIRSCTSYNEAQLILSGQSIAGARCQITGLGGSACAAVFYALNSDISNIKGVNKLLYVAPDELSARRIYEDLLFLNNSDTDVLMLKPAEYMMYDVTARSGDVSHGRTAILAQIAARTLENNGNGKMNGRAGGRKLIVVASASAASQPLPRAERIAGSAVEIERGMVIEIAELTDLMARTGYERVAQVEGRGQYAVRGDIVDIYPYAADAPYRLEFFDNEIDSLRIFDTYTQRTVEDAEHLSLLPDRETYIWDAKHAERVRELLREELSNVVLGSEAYKRLSADIERIAPMRQFTGYDRYIPYVYMADKSDSADSITTIFDYMKDSVMIVEQPDICRETTENVIADHVRICETIAQTTFLPSKTPELLVNPDIISHKITENAFSIAYAEEFATSGKRHNNRHLQSVHFDFSTVSAFGDKTDLLVSEVRRWISERFCVILLAETEGKTRRIEALLRENGVPAVIVADRALITEREGVYICIGGLHNGFVCAEQRLAVVSDGALFKRESARVRRKLKGKAITSFADIQPGDIVVHDVHGIGKFESVESIEIDGIRKDYIKISYRDDGVLFVPSHQLDSIQKYIGGEGQSPKLNKLGSAEWNKTTSKVKDSLRTYARELVELYAKRRNTEGFRFSKDTVWQREFEEAFIYEETDDQLKCIEEIKADMEAPRPMERLLCGDVGYGKTEVALRAAFKAVCDGKQVAFMVPTTVLAQQHYKNFCERFTGFPMTIDYLCRFRTDAQRRSVTDALAKGKIDILVGTHSLIKDKVKFKDLGLAIIDEEQRFGVGHKEKFKQAHPNVDILSLSATPIPRTLHMSLSGIRDISILEDPPQDRLPVQTYVAEWEPAMIRQAVLREMARSGQIFYLYNRVQKMPEKLRLLQELIPEARICVAHGQMGERELEDVMQAFYRNEYDVLLCTTIIESGLDMPNVNTIIVEDSDHMGLAQLYQIRGRVGRGSRLAYAYITYRMNKSLNETAVKRLRTIRDYTEFGSGFKIALRDLEIRGAGSVLGERQHGQMAVVGYETYCKLLDEVIVEESGGSVQPSIQVSVEINVSAYIGDDYIEDEESRIDIYRKIARADSEEDALEITDELIDRYGDVPESVINLIKVAQIRHAAERCAFSAVIEKSGSDGEKIVFMLSQGGVFPQSKSFIDKYGRNISFDLSASPSVSLACNRRDTRKMRLDAVLSFLRDYESMNLRSEAAAGEH